MKKIILSIIAITMLIGCKKEEKKMPVVPVADETVATVSQECYAGISNKDTVMMSLNLKGNEVTDGKLVYKIYEKDSNDGQLVGKIKGDTLIGKYTFLSEGAVSVREVVFLKKGDTYVEGFGEIVDDNHGNVTFKDIRTLKFDSKNVLKKTICE